ncbi:MAG TPA: family 16 glycosylhydrolase [Bryobacteraceae bacterium]|jgi:hypothetical protein|nr:family 16 glycosylhydrolase [Bryobacteraceae bacterium]
MAYASILDIPTPAALEYLGGYKLKFMENFYNIDVDMKPYSQQYHTWLNGIWFNNPPVLNDKASIVAANGVGTLTWLKSSIPSYNTTIRSMQDFRFGYFESHFRFDNIDGSWPAFWLLSSETLNNRHINSGEFDIMEWVSSTPDKCFFNFHKWAPGGEQMLGGGQYSITFERPQDFSFSDYHTYGMLWTPGNADWYVDNKWIGSCSIDHEIEDQHYYLMLGSQAGLNWKDDPATLEKITSEQIQVQSKWIRVWQVSP